MAHMASPTSDGSRLGPRVTAQTKLGSEVRQSLWLIGMTALTLLASIGVGILAGQLG
jgi:hypothetical protein